MNKEDVLKASRKENKNKDLVERELMHKSGAVSMRVGATTCILLALLGFILADRFIFSPWIIYSIILGTHWLMIYISFKKISDLIITIILYSAAIGCFVGFILMLLGK